jgi:hypothetical protein
MQQQPLHPDVAAEMARLEKENRELREIVNAMMGEDEPGLTKEKILSEMITSPPFDEFLKGLAPQESN